MADSNFTASQVLDSQHSQQSDPTGLQNQAAQPQSQNHGMPAIRPFASLPVNIPGFRQPQCPAAQGPPTNCPPPNPAAVGNANAVRNRRAQPVGGGQRRGPQPQWTVLELGVLIQAKRMEEESFGATRGRDRHKTADQRWAEVFRQCQQDGLQRSVNQCKKRWDKVSGEFKKIWDWQVAIPSGQLGYWEMAIDEKRRRKLPLYYPHEVYDQMEPWVPAHKGLNPHEHQVVDSLGEDGENDPELSYFSGATADTSSLPEGYESAAAAPDIDVPAGFDPPLEPEATEPVSNGESQLPGGRQSNVTSPEEYNVRNGWRRSSKKARTEETFTRMTGSFLDALVADSTVRNLHDDEFIGIEKERLQIEDEQLDELSWSYDEAEDGDSDIEEECAYEQMMADNWEEDNLQDSDWDDDEESEPKDGLDIWVADRKEWAHLLGTYYLGVALHHFAFRRLFASKPGVEGGFITLFAEATMSVWMNPRMRLANYQRI